MFKCFILRLDPINVPTLRMNLSAPRTCCLDNNTSTISSLAVERRWNKQTKTFKWQKCFLLWRNLFKRVFVIPSTCPVTAGVQEGMCSPVTEVNRPENKKNKDYFINGMNWNKKNWKHKPNCPCGITITRRLNEKW